MWNVIFGDPATKKATWDIILSGCADLEYVKHMVKRYNEDQVAEEKRWKPGGEYHADTPASAYSYRPYRPSATLGWRYAMVKVPVEQDFAARELARTDNPIRFPQEMADAAGWDDHLWPEFVPPNKVKVYASKNHAFEGRRTEMRLGKFLKDHCRYMDETQISEFVASMGIQFGDATLRFATTREEIRTIYEEGPNSCMSHKAADFGTFEKGGDKPVHPCEAYASPDLAVAYLDRDGEITARAVVNVHTKRYPRIYGDSTRLEALLKEQGYEPSSYALGGATLARIELQHSKVALPYLDGDATQVRILDDRLEIIKPDIIVNSGQSGYATI